MSTYWDIYCRDCEATAGFSVNHGEEKLNDLLQQQAAWAQISACDLSDFEFRLLGDERGAASQWPRFAHEHLGHDVTLKNEYGVFNGECGAFVRCEKCGCQQSCNLPRKHDGEHQRL